MRVEIEKLTGVDLMVEACEFTSGKKPQGNLQERIYDCRHSPMRTQLFTVKMYDVPYATSVHIVRHACVGQQHYVKSNRPDLTGEERSTEDTVNHMMIVNAQHLEEMAWKRLCKNSELPTRRLMRLIKNAVGKVDMRLAKRMVPECMFLGRCIELKKCKKV